MVRQNRRGIAGAALATGVSLAILGALGSWQLARLRWKTALLARIDAAEQAPPVPLGDAPLPFAKVATHGIWRAGHVLYGIDARDGPGGAMREGAQWLQMLDRPGLAPLLVDRGWVPDGAAPAEDAGKPATVSGYVRTPDAPTIFSPADDAQARHVYTLNPGAIAPLFGGAAPAPFTLIAMGPPGPGGVPEPATALPRPPNNHLQYAFTWFGLGAALLGVFVAFARAESRKPG